MKERSNLWMRTICKIAAGVLVSMIAMGIFAMRTDAAAGTASGKVMELKEPVTVYTEKSTDSEVLVTYKAGEVLFVTGDTGDGWYTVFYRGTTGYLSKTVSSPNAEGGTDGEADTGNSSVDTSASHELVLEEFAGADQEAIDEELSQVNVESTYLVEEVQQHQEAHRNAIIWVIVIAVIAAALVIVGIIAYKRNNTQPKDEAEEESAGNKKVIKDKIDIIDLDKE